MDREKYVPRALQVCPTTNNPDISDVNWVWYTYGMYRVNFGSPAAAFYNARKAEWGDFLTPSVVAWDYCYYKRNRMRRPGAVSHVGDTRIDSGGHKDKGYWAFSPDYYVEKSSFSLHHGNGGRGNLSFFDGHVESLGVGELRELGYTKIILNGAPVTLTSTP